MPPTAGRGVNDGNYPIYLYVTDEDIDAGGKSQPGQDPASAIRRLEESARPVTPEEQEEVRRLLEAHERTCRCAARAPRPLATWPGK